MKKLLMLGLLVSGFANANVYTCGTYALFQGTGNGQYEEVSSRTDPVHKFTIITSEPMIEVQVNDTEIPSVQFWKDYSEYRNNDGIISQSGSTFTIKTAVPDSTGVYIPIKLEYKCIKK